MHILFSVVLLVGNLCNGSVTPVGKINGQAIFPDDLQRIPNSEDSSLSAFDRLVLFRLAIEQAKREKLEQQVDVKHELDLVLYRHFLQSRLKTKSSRLSPSEPELRIYYEQYPLLRLRHLVVRFSNPREKKRSLETVGKIDGLIRSGTPFSKLAENYSQDDTAPLEGDIGERGLHNLHEDFYLRLLSLQPGAVSAQIQNRNGYHYFQVVSRIAFQNAQPQYLSFLSKRLSQDREHRFLGQLLNDLKRNAQIENLQSSKND